MKDPDTPLSDAENTQNNSSDKIHLVGVGAAAGGTEAMKTFFEHVPEDSGMAYVAILHLNPPLDDKLTEILQKSL